LISAGLHSHIEYFQHITSHRVETTLTHRHEGQHAVASVRRGTSDYVTRVVKSDNDHHEMGIEDLSIDKDRLDYANCPVCYTPRGRKRKEWPCQEVGAPKAYSRCRRSYERWQRIDCFLVLMGTYEVGMVTRHCMNWMEVQQCVYESMCAKRVCHCEERSFLQSFEISPGHSSMNST